MDSVRAYDDERTETGYETGGGENRPEIGSDERRMHVRAYNHWVSLLRGRAYPSIEDLDPANIADFGPHSVLLDFSQGIEDPRIAFLGRSLREECGLAAGVERIADVPSRSLLSRLTDHYLQIIANRAPIGFEAEFVGTRGHNTMYRGILMPFSSDEDQIDFIYGVINWKELVDPAVQAALDAELAKSVRETPRTTATAPVWADGPATDAPTPPPAGLAERLDRARATAAAAQSAEGRSRSALYDAIGQAHDVAEAASEDEAGYAALLGEAGISVQARAPMTAVAKLVFGADYDKTRLTEFAAVLTFARRAGVAVGELSRVLLTTEGGIKAIVRAERARRRPAAPAPSTTDPLAERPTLARVQLPHSSAASEYVVLVARASGEMLDIVAALPESPAARAAVKAAGRLA